MKDKKILRGDMFYANLGRGIGSEQKGYRPVLVIQNDVGNKFSPTVIVASITSRNQSETAHALFHKHRRRTSSSVYCFA